jgi:hypothetical protein
MARRVQAGQKAAVANPLPLGSPEQSDDTAGRHMNVQGARQKALENPIHSLQFPQNPFVG